ncbi:hypothetical protein SLEP1_g56668 [Rubroshorea leprosula]|uniref:Uncharacterized protein n=1 Tax=Rubroshorea leprosula TaxID=152421 RepID=A0AAV5MND6_9ROSI|nr:hypothetical protein SLEP1_g56668 [Rubroshorea leprosula]
MVELLPYCCPNFLLGIGGDSVVNGTMILLNSCRS